MFMYLLHKYPVVFIYLFKSRLARGSLRPFFSRVAHFGMHVLRLARCREVVFVADQTVLQTAEWTARRRDRKRMMEHVRERCGERGK